MTENELRQRLNEIEWDDFEVKEATGGLPKSMWETVSAFSNTSGGQIGGQKDIITPSNTSDFEKNINTSGGQKAVIRNGGQKQGEETRAKIIEAMRIKPEISRKELTEIIGISSSAIQKHIEYLKNSGIIVRLGSDRKGLWRVLK